MVKCYKTIAKEYLEEKDRGKIMIVSVQKQTILNPPQLISIFAGSSGKSSHYK